MIDCNTLKTILALSEDSGFNATELLIVLLGAYGNKYGRVYLSRRSGISERRIRRIYEYLRNPTKINRERINRLLEALSSATIVTIQLNGLSATFIRAVDKGLLEAVKTRVVELRDWIIVEARDRDCIEVIGVIDGELTFPMLPGEFYEKYKALIPRENLKEGTLVVIWRKYTPILSESTVMHALARICEKISIS